MKTLIKLFAMTHHIPVVVRTNESMVYYRTVARITGRQLHHSLYGYILD